MISFKKLLFGAVCRAIKAQYHLIRKSFFLVLLFLSLSIMSCGRREPSDPYSLIQPGKTLLHYSEFELIDGFTRGVNKNRHGGVWKARAKGKTEVTLNADRIDSLNPAGGSLQITCSGSGASICFAESSFKNLDMSQAKKLVARIKKIPWQLFEGKIYFALIDKAGQEAQVELIRSYVRPSQIKGGEWASVVIPRKVFKELDFNHLRGIKIILKAKSGTKWESLVFDEIAFYGPKDLYVRSASDNLVSFPKKASNRNIKKLLREKNDKKFLRQIAKDTWRYFDEAVDRQTGLVVDHIRLGRTKGIGDYTSTTNVAFHWLACIAAYDLGFVSKKEAIERIQKSFDTLGRVERWDEKYFYNYYQTRSLEVTRRYVSSVDLAWLTAAFSVLRQAFPGPFDKGAKQFLEDLDFSVFYDEQIGQLRLGFDEDKDEFSPYHYGLLISEARLMSYVAIGKGDLPKTHWARIYRTLPKEWDWQQQTPKGREKTLFNIPLFGGYYLYDGKKILPSWGGSLFEVLAPSLLLKEQTLARKSFALNNRVSVEAHMDYALQKKLYPVWGIAPTAIANGRNWLYKEYGIKAIAAKGYREEGVIAPYASALAIEIKPEEVIRNFRKMLERYPDVYGPYGFYDSVDVLRDRVNQQYLALDQGLMLIAITNYLKDGSIRNRFHQDSIGKNGEILLTEESFFK